MIKFVFLRHFATSIDGAMPCSQWHISEDGRRAMINVVESGRFRGINSIKTSPEPKAHVIAEYIAEKHSLPLEICDEMREVNRDKVGIISEGYEESVKLYLRESSELSYPFEDIAHVRTRIRSWLAGMQYLSGEILCVSHGLWLSILLADYYQKDVFEFWRSLTFGHVLEVNGMDLLKLWLGSLTR